MNVMSSSLGFVGLGNMGAALAIRLIDAGHNLVVFDVRKEAMEPFRARGAKAAASPSEVAALADIVLVCLPTPETVREVALGKDGLVNGSRMKIYIDLSTSGPETAVLVATEFRQRGIAAVDSPISGGVIGARKGTLALMVACEQELFKKLLPVFQNLGKNVFYVGNRPGMGQMLKLINNLLSVTASIVTAEAMVLGVKAGLDPETMLNVINVSSGRNSSTEVKFPNFVLPRTFDSGSVINLMHKDVAMCLKEAEALQVPMWIANSAHHFLRFVASQGGGNQSSTSLVRYFEQWAGVEVKSVK